MHDANIDIHHSYYEEGTPSVEQWPLHDGDSAIHTASYNDDVALVMSLLDNDTATVGINTRDRGDCSPLHLAIRVDHGWVLRFLLKAGVAPTLKDNIEPCNGVSLSALDLAAYLERQNAFIRAHKSRDQYTSKLALPVRFPERCDLPYTDARAAERPRLP